MELSAPQFLTNTMLVNHVSYRTITIVRSMNLFKKMLLLSLKVLVDIITGMDLITINRYMEVFVILVLMLTTFVLIVRSMENVFGARHISILSLVVLIHLVCLVRPYVKDALVPTKRIAFLIVTQIRNITL